MGFTFFPWQLFMYKIWFEIMSHSQKQTFYPQTNKLSFIFFFYTYLFSNTKSVFKGITVKIHPHKTTHEDQECVR